MAYENLKSTGIKYLLQKLKTTFLQIQDAVKSVNGLLPDASGNILVTTVPYSQNLYSSQNYQDSDKFVQRTTAGEASVADGEANLVRVKGNNIHTGYTAESIAMTVTAVSEPAITATLDRNTFVSYVQDSGTITLVYSTDWSDDPTDYGITVVGTPTAGDTIVVVYQKEIPGTITVANPTSFVATGWNLYDNSTGYARVAAYNEGTGLYKVEGTFTALKFATTLSGEQTAITLDSENCFEVSVDGFVFVTGGNSTNTAIFPIWSDWGGGHSGSFKAYTTSTIDLSGIMSTYFPYGLLKAGSVVDEIDLSVGRVYSRVERQINNETNLANAKASGRSYEYDQDYIYIAKASVSPVSVTITSSVTVNEHGIEFFTNTTVPVDAEMLYGNNLKNKLERDVLTISGGLVNNLTSTSTTKALTAAQGKALNTSIKTKASYLNLATRTLALKCEGAETKTYTMTENAHCLIYLNGASVNVTCSINNIQLMAANGFRESVVIPLASGSVIKFVGSSGGYAELNVLT